MILQYDCNFEDTEFKVDFYQCRVKQYKYVYPRISVDRIFYSTTLRSLSIELVY